MDVPVADKLATVGLVALQKDCEAVPVGADGVAFTVTCTGVDAGPVVAVDVQLLSNA